MVLGQLPLAFSHASYSIMTSPSISQRRMSCPSRNFMKLASVTVYVSDVRILFSRFNCSMTPFMKENSDCSSACLLNFKIMSSDV